MVLLKDGISFKLNTKGQPKALPVVYGTVNRTIAVAVKQELEEDPITGTRTLEIDGNKLMLEELEGLKKINSALSPSTHKLFSVAIAEFSKNNHTGAGKSRALKDTWVHIPLKEYATMCGYDVIEHAKKTEEEAIQERKRAKNAMDNARKRVKRDLDLLYSMSMSWREKVNGKDEDFLDIRILETKSIKKGIIGIRFTQTFGEYLVRLPLSQYPTSMLSIDERNTNAYKIAVKMVEHYYMDANIARGVHDRLKVGTLLKVTALPGIDKVKSNENSWGDRIKEPFEKALDELTKAGVLIDWGYCLPGGIRMTDEEATSWANFKDWENTLIYFKIEGCDTEEQDKRRRKNKERREANKSKKKTAKKKTA